MKQKQKNWVEWRRTCRNSFWVRTCVIVINGNGIRLHTQLFSLSVWSPLQLDSTRAKSCSRFLFLGLLVYTTSRWNACRNFWWSHHHFPCLVLECSVHRLITTDGWVGNMVLHSVTSSYWTGLWYPLSGHPLCGGFVGTGRGKGEIRGMFVGRSSWNGYHVVYGWLHHWKHWMDLGFLHTSYHHSSCFLYMVVSCLGLTTDTPTDQW